MGLFIKVQIRYRLRENGTSGRPERDGRGDNGTSHQKTGRLVTLGKVTLYKRVKRTFTNTSIYKGTKVINICVHTTVQYIRQLHNLSSNDVSDQGPGNGFAGAGTSDHIRSVFKHRSDSVSKWRSLLLLE